MALTSAERMRQGRVTDADGREVSSIYVARPTAVTGTDPAAGVEVSETVPAGEVWELLAVRVRLATDATVANRLPSFRLDDGTTIFYSVSVDTNHPASTTRDYNFGAGLGYKDSSSNNGMLNIGIPRFVLLPGYKVTTSTGSLQAGDNYGVPVLLVVKHSA